MKKYFKYDWQLLHLNTKCTKCGNNIPLQNVESAPTCNECGHENKTNWKEIIKTADIIGMRRGGSSKKTMLGTIDATLTVEKAEQIHCLHCKSPLSFNLDDDLKEYHCGSCNQAIHFTNLPGLDDFVFYQYGNAQVESVKPIAVRCISCGAPLEVDPTQNNFTCKFCSTANILPLSMRYKVVLNDVYIGERLSRYPKMLAFEMNGKMVKQSLRDNGRSSFVDEELDKVLLNNKNDLEIYNLIVINYQYLPSDKVLNELFNSSTNQLLIGQVGVRLQKTKEEVNARLQQVNPAPKKPAITKTSNQTFNSPTTRKNFFRKEWPYILIFVVFMLIFLIFGTSLFK